MVHNEEASEYVENSSIWLLDSGTSNHMIVKRELFYQLDENMRQKVRLGDDKEVDVLSKGSVLMNVHGEMKLIHGVQFVPSLAHNLLSVGKLLESGYDVNFSRFVCKIENAKKWCCGDGNLEKGIICFQWSFLQLSRQMQL